MVKLPILLALAALILATGAEWLHTGRIRRVGPLAFGPGKKPGLPGKLAPFLRVAALTAMVWGLAMLLVLPPVAHRGVPKEIDPAHREHLLILLDVSPSMRIQDSGKSGKESRTHRAREVMDSVFARIASDRLFTTVIAVYNGAKPVVEQTRDMEVLHNLMNDLPMHYAFPSGQTKLLDGLEEAARIAKPWPRGSTTLMVVSDGDSVPPTGMPTMPPSIRGVLVIGVGDPGTGTFINGHNSRQDSSTLRQIATRIGGVYHDANLKFVPTDTLSKLGSLASDDSNRPASYRELAITATVLGTLVLSLLPILLHFAGSAWNPGPKTRDFHFPAASRNFMTD
ncbi:VWA domain-containing protein [Luteolibacter pohnpeiensis]|uniref:VWA domain-containing protein n=1 Tax=Luteolibacter pohnpeiensis TaxID=454153 RepID=A0A934S451_9BACT|nr:VWA domain-containing protein [Luteolibacter pohnpeiensis]MBK1881972.1 VWA domain-containing protein [Luteolibacter pohnpeiensis]